MVVKTTRGIASGRFMRLLHSQAGNIMPMAAIAMVALAGMVGGGVDVSRAYMVQNRLQNACDAGVLAGRKAVTTNGYNSSAKGEADTYFNTNFDTANEGVSGTTFTTTTPNGGSTVNGVASASMDTAVMQLFGVDAIPLSVDCTATMSVGNSDVMMVLDTTGSMVCTSAMTSSECGDHIDLYGYDETSHGGDSRLKELKASMKSFYATLEAATSGSNSRIRYGFVPYSSSVNVGQILMTKNSSWIVDTWGYQSREAQFEQVTTETDEVIDYEPPYEEYDTSANNYEYGSWYYYRPTTRYSRSSSCRDASQDDTAWTNDGGSTTSTTTDINGDGERVTTTTVKQPQERRNFSCFYSNYYGGYYRIYRDEERDYNRTTYSIEEPIYATTTTTEFDHWDYKQVNYDTIDYKNGLSVSVPLGTDGANITSDTWLGCIEERDTVAQATFTWDSILGYSPSGALDINIDDAPDVGDDTTKWRPMWPEVGYYRVTDSSFTAYSREDESDFGGKSSSYCPPAAQQFAQMSQTGFDAYADSLVPSGATYHNLGMVWGARFSSPDGMFQTNVNEAPTNNSSVSRHLIFMTDGDMSPSQGAITSYGIEAHDMRVTGDGFTDHTARQTARFLAICEATRAKGIRVWVIAFSSALTTEMSQCASTDSTFTATNAAQLNAAFQEIAKDVGELRITL